ncbi:hypothetical protein [Endozoicomonas sp.]|uniref:hypothetical protein n=1 Tax=Endozoicomonas sp. TaxID=1892382 RepID=UPI00383B16BE
MYPIDTVVKVSGSNVLPDAMYRIVHRTNTETHFVEICNRPRKLSSIINSMVDNDINDKSLYKIKWQLPSHLYLSDEDLKKEWVEERERYREILSPILENIYDFIERNSVGIAVRDEVIGNSGLQKSTVYSKIYKYLMYGKNLNGLLPGHFLKGGYGKQKKTTSDTKVRGRPKKRDKRHGTVNVGDKEKQWIIESYKKYYKKLSANGEKCDTLKQVCHALWYDHYLLDPKADDDDKKFQSDRISEANFYYWIHKLIPDLEIVKREVGKWAFEKDFNYLYGKSRDIVSSPGQIYIIDATPTDVYLASNFELIKTVSPGRMTLYVVVDAFSGLIVGYNISFNNPSLPKALEALFCASIKKSFFGKLIGIDISDEDWPSHHVPAGTLADKAELISGKKDDINLRLCISSAKSCPPYRGDAKGLVESIIKRFNFELSRRLPGAVNKRVIDRGDKDPAEEAVITFSDMHKLTIDLINFLNRRPIDRQYFTQDMSKVGVEPTPIAIWSWGLKHCNSFAIDSDEFDKKLLYTSLSERVEVTINDEGIHVKGTDNRLCYIPGHADLQKLARIYKKTARGSNISQHYTAHRIFGVTDVLYLIPKIMDTSDGSTIIECKLSTRSERFHNMIVDEALMLIEKEMYQDDEITETQHNMRAALIANRRTTVKAANERKAKGKQASRNRKKDKRTHRDIEKSLIARQSFKLAQQALNDNAPDHEEDETSEQPVRDNVKKTSIRRHLIKGLRK